MKERKNKIPVSKREATLVGGFYEIKTSKNNFRLIKAWDYQMELINKFAKDERSEGFIISSERSNMPYIRFRPDLGYRHQSDMYITYIGILAYLEKFPEEFNKPENYKRFSLIVPLLEKIKNGDDKTLDYSQYDIIHLNGNILDITPENLWFIKHNEGKEMVHHRAFMLEYFEDSLLFHNIMKIKAKNPYEQYLRNIRRAELKPLFEDYPDFDIEIMGHNPIRKASKFYALFTELKRYKSTKVPYSTRGIITYIKNVFGVDCEEILRNRVKEFCLKNNLDFNNTIFAQKKYKKFIKINPITNRPKVFNVPYFTLVDINNFKIKEGTYYNLDGSVYIESYYESLSYNELDNLLQQYRKEDEDIFDEVIDELYEP